jgi:hypothetical protein
MTGNGVVRGSCGDAEIVEERLQGDAQTTQ